MTKQLTQDDFKDAPPWVKSAAINANGNCHIFSHKKKDLISRSGKWLIKYQNSCSELYDTGYDTTNWQHSAINRE